MNTRYPINVAGVLAPKGAIALVRGLRSGIERFERAHGRFTRRLETYTEGCLPWQFHHQRGVKTRYRTDIAAELPSIGPIQSERGLIPGLEILARAFGRFTQP